MKRLLPALLLLAALPAQAEIFKWVDENGRTHFGETLPDKYKKSATTLSPQPMNTIPGDKLRGSGAGRAAESGGGDSASAPPEPPAPPPEPLSCEAQWQKFRESQACFARFRNANGSLKPEAAKMCENMEQPPPCQ